MKNGCGSFRNVQWKTYIYRGNQTTEPKGRDAPLVMRVKSGNIERSSELCISSNADVTSQLFSFEASDFYGYLQPAVYVFCGKENKARSRFRTQKKIDDRTAMWKVSASCARTGDGHLGPQCVMQVHLPCAGICRRFVTQHVSCRGCI